MYRILVLFAECKKMLTSIAVARKTISFLSMNCGVCHYIWETFSYVMSPTLVFAYYYAHYQYIHCYILTLYFNQFCIA
jgi:hypothetical protein